MLHGHRVFIESICQIGTVSAARTTRPIPTHVLSSISSSESDLSLIHRGIMWVKLCRFRLSQHLFSWWRLGHNELLACLNVFRFVDVLCSRWRSFVVMALILMIMKLVHRYGIVLEVCEA